MTSCARVTGVVAGVALTFALSLPATGQTHSTAAAQSKVSPPPSAPSPAPSTATAAAGESYTYRSDGRRDPFASLIAAGSDSRDVVKRVDGPAGMSVAEVSVRGVLQGRGAPVAMVQGSDSKTYVMHQGDKFLDGTIRSITPQGLVVVQDVHDPLSLIKQREIRKLLRSLEETKE